MTHQEFIDQYLNYYNYKIKNNILYVIGYDLDLHGLDITELPDNLNIRNQLDIGNTDIHTFPKNLTVGGNLLMSNTKIKKLPDNLKINGHLDISDTPIEALPNGLVVDDLLILELAFDSTPSTKITTLPNDLIANNHIVVSTQMILSEEGQINLIRQSSNYFDIIKNPTEKAKKLHKLLWEI